VTAVKIKGATHEYATLAGVKESVLDIILNLKGLHVKKDSKGPVVLKLEASKEGPVKASDIKVPSDVTILNPDYVIATIDKKGSLSMEITVDKGVGYLPAAARQKTNKEAGVIMVDATFSPIVRVRYDVIATRVGSLTNLDKLELEVLTNGSMTPEDSIKFASNVVKAYFDLFNQQDEIVEGDFIADAEKLAAAATKPALGGASSAGSSEDGAMPVGEGVKSNEKYTPIEILGFSPRTLNALINGGIGSIEQLVKCSPNKIANLRGFGTKALDEVNERLAEKGYKLNEEA
jgi:DNA-directed RNA polymerase subunit alpha